MISVVPSPSRIAQSTFLAPIHSHTSGRDATRLSAPPTRTKRVLKATFSLFAGEHRPSPRVSPSTHVVGRPSCVASRDATQDIKTTFCVRLVSRERDANRRRDTRTRRARDTTHTSKRKLSLCCNSRRRRVFVFVRASSRRPSPPRENALFRNPRRAPNARCHPPRSPPRARPRRWPI